MFYLSDPFCYPRSLLHPGIRLPRHYPPPPSPLASYVYSRVSRQLSFTSHFGTNTFLLPFCGIFQTCKPLPLIHLVNDQFSKLSVSIYTFTHIYPCAFYSFPHPSLIHSRPSVRPSVHPYSHPRILRSKCISSLKNSFRYPTLYIFVSFFSTLPLRVLARPSLSWSHQFTQTSRFIPCYRLPVILCDDFQSNTLINVILLQQGFLKPLLTLKCYFKCFVF